MTIDESSIDREPSRKNLENALKTIDNLQALVNLMATNSARRAAAVNVGKSADGAITIYVTASDNVDEERFARAAVDGLDAVFSEGRRLAHRAAMVRAVVARDFASAMVFYAPTYGFCVRHGIDISHIGTRMGWLPEANAAASLPCAEDFITSVLGEP